MLTFAYPAIFKCDEAGRLFVSFPDFPHSHTDGADENEAMEQAIDCLGSTIAFAIADKADVPPPARLKRGQRLVPVPFWIVGKLALYWAIREAGISQSELARRLKVRETIVRRMLDPNHDTRPENCRPHLKLSASASSWHTTRPNLLDLPTPGSPSPTRQPRPSAGNPDRYTDTSAACDRAPSDAAPSHADRECERDSPPP
ncbi:MAG: hypothetical protein JWP63_5864 [Candidatus Solibacter sp.]|jgi:antitoxin HicB|nr:hypothetical protein [Candidatus Solibacter sp.]